MLANKLIIASRSCCVDVKTLRVLSAAQSLIKYPLRMRHSMTNLYETLGVPYDSTAEEIEKAYAKLAKFFDPSKGDKAM